MHTKTTLIIVRHGETEKNVKGVLHKQNDEEGLTGTGKSQIKKVGFVLKELGAEIVYSSEEYRAKESGQIIAETCDIPFKTIKGMGERNWGDLAEKPWPEIKKVLETFTLDQRYRFVPTNGESWKEFEERLANSLGEIMKETTGKVIVLVSHSGAIRALIPYLLNIPKDESFKYDPKNASISIFEFENGLVTSKVLDSTEHLEN